ncbi:MAG: TIR domain-containing protein [bacterium]
MNPGIFISYSRQDEKQAMHLLAVLRREGYTVWIDQESIAGASIWSDEIVHNIKQSDIFLALLSESSVASSNVSKEIAIAAEHGKIILPIEIGTVNLPGRLEYALAGIQRTNYHDEEAILHAVKSQISRMEEGEPHKESQIATHKSRKQKARKRIYFGIIGIVVIAVLVFFLASKSRVKADVGMSIAVLPFSTLNMENDSTKNLDIFSEGIQTRLSKLEGFSLVNSTLTARYRNTNLNATAIGKELNVRYVIEGIVRKEHDIDFIAVRLFDTQRGGEIWESNYTCNAIELFNLRDKVSLDLHGHIWSLSADEATIKIMEKDVALHPNDASKIANLATKLIGSDKSRSLSLFQRAIKIDSTNVSYFLLAGIVCARQNDRYQSRDYGRAAVSLCRHLLPNHPDSLTLATNYALALDMAEETEAATKCFDSLLLLHPKDIRLLYNTACCYAKQYKGDKALDILDFLFTFAPGKRAEVISDPDFDNIRTNPHYSRTINLH